MIGEFGVGQDLLGELQPILVLFVFITFLREYKNVALVGPLASLSRLN